ncbi:MAG: hypothetical protein JSR84_08730 [Proteobacteria bacterium]|nr:hypothetical protein [Pseudomonadota bacterium]
MLGKIASILFLLTALVIAFGAFGHDSHAARLAIELGKQPLDAHDVKVIILVWHFVSGCMLVFGALCVWAWWRARRGERGALFVSDLIGLFYIVTGLLSVWYSGLVFFWLFFALGALLIITSLPLRRA